MCNVLRAFLSNRVVIVYEVTAVTVTDRFVTLRRDTALQRDVTKYVDEGRDKFKEVT